MRKRMKRTAIPDLSMLKVKPQWWLDIHKPIEIVGYKMPFCIQCKVEHDGVQYEGMLYPVEKMIHTHHYLDMQAIEADKILQIVKVSKSTEDKKEGN